MKELTLDKLPMKVLANLDMETVFVASRCVIAAEKLLVFRKLHGKELSAATVGKRAGIHRKYCESFLDFLVYLGLLRKRKGLYRNSPLANKHFIRERTVDWTRLWSGECAEDYEALTVVEDVISNGGDWRKILGKERKPDYQRVQEDPQWASDFAYALYDANKSNAEILARNLDLSDHHALLDVGGGSGVMSVALARANPHLKACVLELEFVCAAAKRIIRRERMSHRIKALAGDMNKAIPGGFDVIMFWEVGYVDTRVLKMAYESLPTNGMIVLDYYPSAKAKTPSPGRFPYEYLSVRPKGQTRLSKIKSLKTAGFSTIRHRTVEKKLGVITGRKK